MEVKHLEYTIRTRWLVPTDDLAWEPVDGTPAGPYHLYDIRLRSHAGIGNDFWNNDGTPYEVNLAHTAPERAVQLDLIQGVRCEINSVVVLDNAGRKWQTRPSGGGRAKPLRTRNQGRPSAEDNPGKAKVIASLRADFQPRQGRGPRAPFASAWAR